MRGIHESYEYCIKFGFSTAQILTSVGLLQPILLAVNGLLWTIGAEFDRHIPGAASFTVISTLPHTNF